MPLVVVFTVLLLCLFFYKKTYAEPIHPDSAEFIYPGLMQRLGFKKEYYQIYRNNRYESAPLHFNQFPPDPDEVTDKRFDPVGSYPRFRQKMLIWWFFELFYKYFNGAPRQFRLINTILFGAISLILALVLYPLVEPVTALWWMMIFSLLLMLPHFDFYQIHAEIWGALGVVTAFYWLMLNAGTGNPYYLLMAGGILFVVFFLVKITFLPTIGFFVFLPVILTGSWYNTFILTIAIGGALLVFVAILFLSGRGKPLLWAYNIANWGKYHEKALTTRLHNQNKNTDNIATENVLRHYRLEAGLVLLACMMGLIWLFIEEKTVLQSVLAIWILTAAAEMIIQRKFYPSHFIPITAPGILFIALLPGSTFIIPLKILFSGGVIILWLRWYIFNPLTLTEAYGYVSRNPFVKSLLSTDEVAQFIRENSEPDDKIVALGYASPVYVLAKRKAALGLMESILTLEPDNMDRLYGHRWWWWVKKSIRQSMAKFIIDFDGRLQVDELNQSTGLHYELERTISATIRIFKLKQIDTLQDPSAVYE